MKDCLKCGFPTRQTNEGKCCPWCGFRWRSAMTMDGDWIKDGGLLYSYSRRDYEREVPWGCLLVMNENL